MVPYSVCSLNQRVFLCSASARILPPAGQDKGVCDSHGPVRYAVLAQAEQKQMLPVLLPRLRLVALSKWTSTNPLSWIGFYNEGGELAVFH